jgi:hypothetical protein
LWFEYTFSSTASHASHGAIMRTREDVITVIPRAVRLCVNLTGMRANIPGDLAPLVFAQGVAPGPACRRHAEQDSPLVRTS